MGVGKLKLRLMQSLACVGLLVTAFLIWSAFQAGPIAGCSSDGVFNCDHVLTSRWSKVFGISVSIPAAAIYMSLLGGLIVAGREKSNDATRKVAWSVASVAIFAAAASALWFIGLQVLVLGHLCKYCLVVHSISIILAALHLHSRVLPRTGWGQHIAIGFAASLVLIACQVFGPVAKTYEVESYQAGTDTSGEDFDAFEFEMDEFDMDDELGLDSPVVENAIASDTIEVDPETTQHPEGVIPIETTSPSPPEPSTTPAPPQLPPPTPSLTPIPDTAQEGQTLTSRSVPKAEKRYVMFPGAKAKLNVNQWPMLGSPTADHVFVELFDYTCGHCRQMNKHLDVVRSRYGNQIAIMVLPVPLDGKCNQTVGATAAGHEEACELARLALAVWRLRPDAFEAYHQWLLEAATSRTAYEARQRAEAIVGNRAALAEQMQGKTISAFLSKHVKIYERAGQGTLPKLFSERLTVKGTVASAEELCTLLEQSHSFAR